MRLRRVAVALLPSLLLVAAILGWFLARKLRHTPAAPQAGTAAAGPGTGAPAPHPGGSDSSLMSLSEPLPAEEELPMPSCWQGLLALDQRASLDELYAALLAAGGDAALSEYLQERLAEVVGRDPARAQQVLAWAHKAGPPVLDGLLGALKRTEAVQDPQIAGGLLRLAGNKEEPLERRGAALNALETQRHLDAGGIAQLKAVALDDASEGTAWLATRTLGRVMKEDFERTGSYKPYWQTLLDLGQRSPETGVRLLALEMPSYSEPLVEEDSVEKLAKIVRTDPDPAVREMAALRLSLSAAPQPALAAMRAAFPEEKDRCVRWALFRFSVRIAGPAALPVLAEYTRIDPRFKEDYEEFRGLYSSGTVDFARIWLGKTEHIQCPPEEGEG